MRRESASEPPDAAPRPGLAPARQPPAPARERARGSDPCPPGPIARLLALVAEAPDAPMVRFDHSETASSAALTATLRAIGRDRRGDQTVLSRGEVLTEVGRMAAALRAAGTREGDRVALVLPNCAELLLAHLALWALRAVAVVLSPIGAPGRIARCLQDAEAAGIVAEAETLTALVNSGAALPPFRFQVCAGTSPGGEGISLDALYRQETAEPEITEPPPEQEATVHFTYKGIGYPLGAVHTYDHLARGTDAMVRFFRPTEEHTFLCVLPLSAVYTLITCVLIPLHAGGVTAIVRGAKPQHLLQRAASHEANVLCLIPELYRLLGLCARRTNLDLTTVHWMSGGAHLTADHYQELGQEFQVWPFQGYGLTEALVVTACNWEHNRPGALGVPLFSDTEISVLSPGGEPLAHGETGEIAVRTPTLMTRYVGRPQETARFLRDGAVLTGDLGRVDEDGFLHYVGGCRPFAKVAGFMVDLTEVELAMTTHPDVRACVATTRPRGPSHNQVLAEVTLFAGAEITPLALREHCREHLAFYKVPREVTIRNA